MSAVVIHAAPGPLADRLIHRLAAAGVSPALVEADPTADVATLARRFAGARVVHNATAPFFDHGHIVIEAALAAGCHYLDTSDEHDWLLKVRDAWHARFAAADRLLLPGLAQPFATSEIAANLALETPGAEVLDVMMLWNDVTAESTSRQLQHVVQSNGFDCADPAAWPLDRVMHVRLPGRARPGMAIRLHESPHCLWFDHDDRVSELRTYGGTSERAGIEKALADDGCCAGTSQGTSPWHEEWRSPLAQGEAVDASIDSVWSRGSGHRTHVVLEGQAPYDQTAALHARAAMRLCSEPPARVGFASGCQAFGHRDLLDALTSSETVRQPLVHVER